MRGQRRILSGSGYGLPQFTRTAQCRVAACSVTPGRTPQSQLVCRLCSNQKGSPRNCGCGDPALPCQYAGIGPQPGGAGIHVPGAGRGAGHFTFCKRVPGGVHCHRHGGKTVASVEAALRRDWRGGTVGSGKFRRDHRGRGYQGDAPRSGSGRRRFQDREIVLNGVKLGSRNIVSRSCRIFRREHGAKRSGRRPEGRSNGRAAGGSGKKRRRGRGYGGPEFAAY